MLDQPLNSLGLPKAPADTRVVVAMSGGVDSSVVAAMLKDEGYDVVGVTLQLYDHGAALAKKGACCAGRDIHDARRVAEAMGFPHYVLDYENTFREAVIEEFADAYLAGATPVPCIRCNERVKFKDLLATAKDLNADCMATGHYIQRKLGAGPELPELSFIGRSMPTGTKAISCSRPRPSSWTTCAFRWAIWQARPRPGRWQPSMACRSRTSRTVRTSALCRTGTMPPSSKSCGRGLRTRARSSIWRGAFWASTAGVIHYTVGQRRGLDIGGLSEPLYVVRLDPASRQVIVGPKAALSTRTIPVREINWLGDAPFDSRAEWHLEVKVRSTRPPRAAIVRPLSATEAEVELLDPEDGVSAGQACVFYAPEGSRVFGGGWIWRGK